MERGLVLSIFPGLDLLGMGFQQEGFYVVMGPDVLFGQSIQDYHVPSGVFEGVIGGPPCQAFSIARGSSKPTQGNHIPEFERIVSEARPAWFVMENVPNAPLPIVQGYHTSWFFVQAAELGLCHRRKRRITIGSMSQKLIFNIRGEMARDPEPCIMATEYNSASAGNRWVKSKRFPKRLLPDIAERMGLSRDWDAPALLWEYKYRVLGNGVPLPVARLLAQLIKSQVRPIEEEHGDHHSPA